MNIVLQKKDKWIFAIIVFLFTGFNNKTESSYKVFTTYFVKQYNEFKIPQLTLSYQDNIRSVQSLDTLKAQEKFFQSMQRQLNSFKRNELSTNDRLDYDLITYECRANLNRLQVEIGFKQAADTISTNGLVNMRNGKDWYRYFLNRWIGDESTPEQIYDFGISEIEKILKEMNHIQTKLALNTAEFQKVLKSDSFFITKAERIQDFFENAKNRVSANMPRLFNVKKVPELAIQKGTNESLKNVPGYYSDNTFYYNYFGQPYNRRQIDWLFLHEGIPGHHYQLAILRKISSSSVRDLFSYPGVNEGWAAYVEDYGKELGLYKTPYDEYGKLEWNLIRCVRIPMDVGLNYLGWTDKQALGFWNKYLHGMDEIADREIKRMKRWPAQVVSYRFGANQLIELRKGLENEKHPFDIKMFHDKVLVNGGLPFPILRNRVLESYQMNRKSE